MGVKDTLFSTKKTLNIRGIPHIIEHPWIMGILNLTPDSFYVGSRVKSESQILSGVEKMVVEGADLIDLGGYSSRPGASEVPLDIELQRVVPAIQSIIKRFPDSLISVDTFRPEVARQAVEAGAIMVNDISGGLHDEKMAVTIAKLKVPYVVMHMRGNSQNMNSLTNYDNLLKEIAVYFNRRISLLKELGVSDIILDPGFGFAKTIDQNYELLRNLSYFEFLEFPLLVGLSRKSMIFKKLGIDSEDALNGTTVLNTWAVLKKASILRVHDVKEAKQIVELIGLN